MATIENSKIKPGRIFSLHTQVLSILLGTAVLLTFTLTALYLSINYFSLMVQFSKENDLRLHKLGKILSVPFLKQDYVMIVDIIDAEVKNSDLDYIWVVDKGLVVACNDESQVMRPFDPSHVSRAGFRSFTTPEGFTISVLPNYAIISQIGLRVLVGSIIAIFAVIAIAWVLASRLSRRISGPIAEAVAASSEIACGRFDLSFAGTTIPEINTLFESLTNTAARLKELTASLEEEKSRIKESEEKYRRLVENLPDTYFFFSFTPEGTIIYLSPSIKTVLGYTPDESQVISRHLINEGSIAKALLRTRDMKVKPYELELSHKDGTPRTLEILEVPVFDGEGRVALIEGIARDITIEKKAEKELIQAQKMETIGSLAGGIAHDFNNILGGIIGTVSIMKHKLQSGSGLKNEEVNGYLNVLDNASQNASTLVNQILTLSRKQEFHLTIVDLNDTMRYVTKICENTFDRSIRLLTTYHPGKALALADPVQIEQVLLNLCVNACHAMTIMRGEDTAWGGTLGLSISTAAPEQDFSLSHDRTEKVPYWVIMISDSGVGMDARTVGRIFDPFFTTKEKGLGTGLGLAIAYNIIKQHKGFIHAYSEKGLGSTMKVYLPVHEGEDEARIKPVQEMCIRGNGTILVVDDEEIIRNTAKVILMECGYDVITAKDGLDAVGLFSRMHGQIAAVLLDMVMPRMSGKETFEEMRKIDPEVRVLLTSGFKRDERVQKVLDLGMVDFIQKPFTLQSLSEAVHKVVLMEKNPA